jgi:RimJ/RimL family protein N-acetyltransferase
VQILFRPFHADDLSELRTWFEDAEVARRLSFPTDEWFAYVTAGETASCWAATGADDRMIGQLQIDREDSGLGYLEFVLRPDLQGRGTGTAMLRAFLAGPGQGYTAVEAHIEADNSASIACCRRCDFTMLPERDADGFVRAIYRGTP